MTPSSNRPTKSPSIVAEVRKLLAADAQAASFLEEAALPDPSVSVNLPPTSLVSGQFRIIGMLGQGGMGVVYRAEDRVLSRAVALKFLPGSLSATTHGLERFKREARAAAALNHPNICVVYETGEHEGQPFIVMELLEGQTLKQRIGAQPLEVEELLDWAVQIASGLEAAHQAGIVHRDIKPANIFITAQGQVKILDFGLAKATAKSTPGSTRLADADLTTPGMAVGTVSYMSPEQTCGQELDERTDLFSFGAVLYEMATRKQAFSGETTAIIQEAILRRVLPPASSLNARLPRGLDRVIAKALEKDRESRYQHAADLRADLKRVKEAPRPRSGPPWHTVRSRSPRRSSPSWQSWWSDGLVTPEACGSGGPSRDCARRFRELDRRSCVRQRIEHRASHRSEAIAFFC